MRTWYLLIGFIVGILIGFNRPAWAATIQSDIDDLAVQSGFIFRGTVKKLNAGGSDGTPDSSRVVVLVDEVLRSAGAFVDSTGVKVTVNLKQPDSVKIGQQFIFFANFTDVAYFTDFNEYLILSTIGNGVVVNEVGRTEAPASSDALRQQIAAASQRLADRKLEQRLAENVKEVKSLLIGVVKQYNTNQGCGCYFKTPAAARKAPWQAGGPYIFLAADEQQAIVNLGGKDIELKLVESNENPDPNYKDKVGDKYVRVYRAGDIIARLEYVVTEVCGPKSVKFCEWEEADAVITVQQGSKKQTMRLKGGCGC